MLPFGARLSLLEKYSFSLSSATQPLIIPHNNLIDAVSYFKKVIKL